MALGGFSCPWCGYYNAIDERRCGRCARWIPPKPVAEMLRRLPPESAPATKALIALNVFVFVGELMTSMPKSIPIMNSFPLSVLIEFGAFDNELGRSEPWRWLSACFVHMSLLHIALNMLSLWQLGRAMERVFGSTRFVVAYVLTGIAGFATTTLWYGQAPFVTAGASGAIFGLTGLFVAMLIQRQHPRWKEVVVQIVVSSLILTFAFPVNNSAHLGGAAAGALLGLLLPRTFRRELWRPLFAALAFLSALACLGSIVAPPLDKAWRPYRQAEDARNAIEQLDLFNPEN